MRGLRSFRPSVSKLIKRKIQTKIQRRMKNLQSPISSQARSYALLLTQSRGHTETEADRGVDDVVYSANSNRYGHSLN